MAKTLDEVSIHELLDRSCIAFEFVQEKLKEHIHFKRLPLELRVLIERVNGTLWDIYQRFGAMEIERIKKNAKRNR